MALNFPSPAYDGEIYVDPTSGSKYIYVAASTKWMSIQHIPVTTAYGFDKANSAYLTANVAFAVANAALPNVSNAVFAGNLRVTGNLQIGTNTVTITDSAIMAQAFYIMDNGSPVAVSTGTTSNASYGVANAAFSKANNALANTGNVSFNGSLNFSDNSTLRFGANPEDMPLGTLEMVSSNASRISLASDLAAEIRFSDKFNTSGAASISYTPGGHTLETRNDYTNAEIRNYSDGFVWGNYGAGNYSTVVYLNALTRQLNHTGSMNIANSLLIGTTNVVPSFTAANNYASAVGTSTNNYTSATYSTLTQFGSVFDVANAAYGAANNVGPQIAPAFNTANAAFASANNVGPQIAPAFNTANASFAKANTALQNTNGTFAGTLTITGDLYTGVNGTSSNIYMGDTDEGTRRIHCNSNRIGFLNSSDNWGSFCDDSGYWQSDYSVRAPIFYDSNDTGYYLDPNSTSNLYRVNVNGSSLSGSGYTRLVNGVILQWGSQTLGGDREVDFSFPISFPNGCYGFAASGDWWGTNGWMATGGRPISASVYRLYNIVEGTLGVWWVAVGY